MKLQTFTASNMAEALQMVKRTLGPNAVILHTRTTQQRYWLGLRRREMVEITAGPSEPRPKRAAGGSGAGLGVNGLAINSPAAAYVKHSTRAATPAPPVTASGVGLGLSAPTSAAATDLAGAMVKLVASEMSEVKSELKRLVSQVRSGGVGGTGGGGPAVPEELYRHYEQLLQNSVAAELAEDIVKAVRLQVPAGYLGNESFVRSKVAEQIEKLMPAAGPIRRTKAAGAHVVALIGPTGVGKTTTLAKLAAELQLREGKRVGMITIDTYRIAAVDQLRKYAEIIGSPLKVVSSPEEMPAAVAAMQDLDYVLIDTAGRSPTDSMKLSELRQFLDAATPDEVHLVLSTTSDPRCVEMAVAAFSRVRVDRILFTKIDEAATVGVVLNVARKVNKAISYLTTGQDVPYDIEVFRGGRLAAMILGRSEETIGRSTISGDSLSRQKGVVSAGGATANEGSSKARLIAAGGVQ